MKSEATMPRTTAIGLSLLAALLCLATPARADEAPDAYVEYTRARIRKAEAARTTDREARRERLARLEEAREAFTAHEGEDRMDANAWSAAVLAVYDADGDGRLARTELELLQADRREEQGSKQPPEGESQRKRRLAEERRVKKSPAVEVRSPETERQER